MKSGVFKILLISMLALIGIQSITPTVARISDVVKSLMDTDEANTLEEEGSNDLEKELKKGMNEYTIVEITFDILLNSNAVIPSFLNCNTLSSIKNISTPPPDMI